MLLLRCSVLLVGVLAGLAAADQPLGHLRSLGDGRAVVAFDTGVALDPGLIIAAYAPGRVERHPLTEDVLIEDRRLVAKLQVLDGRDGVYQTRLAWIAEGVTLDIGFDCIPLPAEAAPNGVPVVRGIAPLTAQPGEVITLRAEASDPDGDALVSAWSVPADGRGGRLVAPIIVGTSTAWVAPAVEGPVAVTVTVRDPLGQEATATATITVAGSVDARSRSPQVVASIGVARRLAHLGRAQDGSWFALDRGDGVVVEATPGWTGLFPFAIQGEAPGAIAGVAVHGEEVFILDGSKRQVRVYGRDGKARRSFAALYKPTDILVAPDGTVFIADMGVGGVVVHEADGAFRCRLGYEGPGRDGFSGLTRIARAGDGTLACLDASARRVLRYDRFGRHLGAWDVPGDAKIPPMDLAWHSSGLLVLMADGRILILDQAGVAGESWPQPSSGEWGIDFEEPADLHVDVDGHTYVTYPGLATVVRRDRLGKITGVRSSDAVARCALFRMSGAGHLAGLETRFGSVRIFDTQGFLIRYLPKIGRTILDIALTPGGHHLIALDRTEYCIKRIDLTEAVPKPLVVGARGENLGQFKDPQKIAVDEAGRMYVLDISLRRVSVFDAEGRYLLQVNGADKGSTYMDEAAFLAVAPDGSAVYVYDEDRDEIKKYKIDHAAKTASFITNAGGNGTKPGQFRSPVAMSCDRYGLLHVFDSGRKDVQVIDFRGSNAVPLQAWGFEKVLGQRSVEQATAGPDALFIVGPAGGGQVYAW